MKKLKSTTFSEFIRNASEEEKEKVFRVVLGQACEDQRAIVNNQIIRGGEVQHEVRTLHDLLTVNREKHG